MSPNDVINAVANTVGYCPEEPIKLPKKLDPEHIQESIISLNKQKQARKAAKRLKLKEMSEVC